MRKYEGVADEELIVMLRDGDETVMDYLLEKYKKLVKVKAKSMYLLGGDRDDLIQEGMIGLYKAIREYDNERDANFSTFASLVITRQLYAVIRTSTRKKHSPLNDAISLSDGDEISADQMPISLINDAFNPESLYIDKENEEFIEDTIENVLSPFEREVLDLHLTGMKYTEIARVLGKDEKSTDNALQRIRNKLKKHIKKTL